MEILTLLMLLAKSVLMPFEEQCRNLNDPFNADPFRLEPNAEKCMPKRNRRRAPSRTFRPGYHCPQPAT
jgi:hypothetical protein